MTRRKGKGAPLGGVVVDAGGRPVTDEGGRLVFRQPGSGALVLDPAGTPPLGEVTATGTDQGPADAAPAPGA